MSVKNTESFSHCTDVTEIRLEGLTAVAFSSSKEGNSLMKTYPN